jgi:putative transcriptional regulator
MPIKENRDIGMEVLEGIQAIKAHKTGKIKLRTHTLRAPGSPKSIRAKMGVSQAAFAGLMGVSLRTIQDWEQGRRQPSGPAEALLRIAEQKPEVFLELV